MKLKSTFSKTVLGLSILLAATSVGNKAHGQIISYTNDTGGVMNMIAPNASCDTLTRVNGALRLSSPCTNGFSTRGFISSTTYSDTTKAIQVTVTPNVGYGLYVTGFSADLRHSNTGAQSARFAYSVNGGTTWINQGSNQTPFASGTCDSMATGTWTTSFNVIYPYSLKFRVYGFNATAVTGNMQILNLLINGTVHTGPSAIEEVSDESGMSIYPNPVNDASVLSYHLSGDQNVSVSVYNILGQEVSTMVNNTTQQAGDYQLPIAVSTPGMYYVRLTAGDQVYSKKFIKL